MSGLNPSVEYRPVPGFPGYLVGNDGSVWSCWKPCNVGGRLNGATLTDRVQKRLVESIRKRRPHSPHAVAYRTVSGRSEAGRIVQRYVHRLVLEAFVGPCPSGMQCRHLDGNPGNNRLDNLEWSTPRVNNDDKLTHGTMIHAGTITATNRPVERPNSRLTEDQAREVLSLHESGLRICDIVRRFNVSRGCIRGVISGTNWKGIR